MAIENQREAFEAWMRENGQQDSELDRFDDDDEDQPGEYENWFAELAWMAWQASRENAKKTMCNRS